MNTHRVVAMVMAVTLTGFVQTLAAEDKIDVSPVDAALSQNTSEQKPAEQTPNLESATPVQTFAKPADQLLSEMKVYPSF